jgi:glutamate dehydrogenase
MVDAALYCNQDALLVAQLYFAVSDYLDLPWFAQQISDVKVDNYWQAMARESYLDDLEVLLRSLVTILIPQVNDAASVDDAIETWASQEHILVARWKKMTSELQATSNADFAVFSVALRELRDLATSDTAIAE